MIKLKQLGQQQFHILILYFGNFTLIVAQFGEKKNN